MRWIFSLLFLLPSASWAQSAYCEDTDQVIREAIEYHLTGAPTTELPLTCAKKRRWKYFNPDLAERSPEPGPEPEYTWYDPRRDAYKIKKIRRSGPRYLADVEFVIRGKKILSTYIYQPWDLLQREFGVCGTVVNNTKPYIFRADCRK